MANSKLYCKEDFEALTHENMDSLEGKKCDTSCIIILNNKSRS